MTNYLSAIQDLNRSAAFSKSAWKYLSENVSADYADQLAAIGIASFDKGFLFIPDPLPFKSLVSSIFPETMNPVVLLRTSFADLFVYHDGTITLYQSSFNKKMDVAEDIDYFFDVFLPEKGFFDQFLFRDLHQHAGEKLGSLNHDECYGFVPALPLGGEEVIDNVQKVKMMEYLEIVVQANH